MRGYSSYYSDYEPMEGYGMGVFIYGDLLMDSHPRFENVTISDNSGAVGAGAYFIYSSLFIPFIHSLRFL